MTESVRWQIVIEFPDGWTRFAVQEVLDEIERNQINRPWKPEIRKVRPGKLMFEDVVQWAEAHQHEHPNHGANCICADKMIRKVWRAITIEGYQSPYPRPNRVVAVQRRIDWIITSAVRRY